MPVSRIKDLPYPERIESLEDVKEYLKDLRNRLQEDQSERIEDFDQLKLDNVPHIDARAYGMSPSATAARNRIYLQAAIDGAPTSGTVVIPRMSTAYSLDNTTPLTITHGLTVKIRGEIDFSEDDKDFCDVTGNDVTITGEGGKITGPGTFDQSGSIASAVFHVTGDRFTCRDLTLEDPVQCGIWLDGSNDDVVSGVKIIGGTESGTGSGTANYGIQIDGTSVGLSFTDVKIVPNASSGVMVQGIAGGSSAQQHITITGCYFEACHDHATYLFGDYHTITGNTANSIVGSAFKLVGKYSTIANNVADSPAKGGIDISNCDGAVITGNIITLSGYVGIDIYEYGTYTGEFSNMIIANNSIEGAASGAVYSGIRLDTANLASSNVQIVNNILQDVDSSDGNYNGIWVYSDGTQDIDRIKISGNIIDNIGGIGIKCDYVVQSEITDNRIKYPGQHTSTNHEGIRLNSNCDDVYIAQNRIIGDGSNMPYGINIVASASNTNCILENNRILVAATGEVLFTASEGHKAFHTDASGHTAWGYSDTAKFALHDASGVEIGFLQLASTVLNIDADSDIRLYPNNTLSATFLADGGLIMASLKSGATQGAAGATENELWHDTDDDTIKLGAST